MSEFLRKVIERNDHVPSGACLKSFRQNFSNAINVEWKGKAKYFEAIFYKDNLEHIALFDLTGTLLEYKHHLPVGYLPCPIKSRVESKGEIMNAVLINRGNAVEYEVIFRNRAFKRYAITFSEIGRVLEENSL